MRPDADEGEKRTNEIGTIVPLLETLPDIAGLTVNAGALLTQRALARYLLGKRWSGRPPPHGVTVRQAINARGVRSRVRRASMDNVSIIGIDISKRSFQLHGATVSGKTQHFSWVTDLPIDDARAMALMRGARARWRIENETFNTLKNQGYRFEHNFGQGGRGSHRATLQGVRVPIAHATFDHSGSSLPHARTERASGNC